MPLLCSAYGISYSYELVDMEFDLSSSTCCFTIVTLVSFLTVALSNFCTESTVSHNDLLLWLSHLSYS